MRFAGFFLVSALLVSSYGARITEIKVSGEKRLSEDYIINLSGLKLGSEFSIYLLQDALRALYDGERFRDVAAEVEETHEGVIVQFIVDENPILDGWEFKGNKKIKKDELEKELGLERAKPISKKCIWESKNKIENLYKKKGYVNVKVDVSSYESKDGKVILKIDINEGEKTRIKKIIIEGARQLDVNKVRKKLLVYEKGFLRSGKFDVEKFREGKEKLVEYYREKGFIDAKIERDSIWVSGRDIYVLVQLYEGPQYFVSSVEFSGDSLIQEDLLLKLLGFNKGDILNMKKYGNGLSSIYAAYGDSGYIHCSIRDDIARGDFFPTDSSKRFASISLVIDEGNPAYVHLIDIKGNTKTFEKVIRRELAVKPGEIFRRNKLMRSIRNLYYLNYFEEVTPEWQILENGDVDLVLKVTEKAVGSIQGGVGYNAVDKLVGTFSVKVPNLLGRGWDSSLDLQFGSRRVDISLSFTEPYLFDTPTAFGFDLYSTRWKWEGYYTEEKRGGGIRLGRKLKWPDDYFSVSLAYHLESLRYFDFSSSYNPNPAYDLRKKTYPIYRSALNLGLSRDSRDNSFYATSGNFNTLGVELAGGPLLGDDQYQKAIFKSWWFFPIFKYLSFVAKGKFGLLVNVWDKTKDVPFSERFFVGGISSDGQLRGYPDRSISPSIWTTVEGDTTGKKYEFLIGGRSLIILSTELRVPAVKDQLYFSIFAECGNTWLTPKQTSLKDIKRSVGTGVRFVIPMMGILGFDLGYGFDRPKGAGLEFHFQIGPEQ